MVVREDALNGRNPLAAGQWGCRRQSGASHWRAEGDGGDEEGEDGRAQGHAGTFDDNCPTARDMACWYRRATASGRTKRRTATAAVARPAVREGVAFGAAPRAGPQLAWIAQLATDPARPSFIIESSLGAQIGLATLSVEGVQAKLGIAIQDARRASLSNCEEAVRLLADAAFRVLPLQRIEVRVLPSNELAVEVYEQAGFTREGVLRKIAHNAGKAQDELILSLLWEEWMAQRDSI